MEGLVILALLVAAGLVLLLVLGGGLVVLIKLGVIGQHLLRPPEPPDEGEYRLDQSHSSDPEE